MDICIHMCEHTHIHVCTYICVHINGQIHVKNVKGYKLHSELYSVFTWILCPCPFSSYNEIHNKSFMSEVLCFCYYLCLKREISLLREQLVTITYEQFKGFMEIFYIWYIFTQGFRQLKDKKKTETMVSWVSFIDFVLGIKN